MAVTGAATIGQTGTTFNEITTASLVLAGLLVLLRAVAGGGVRLRHTLGAGLLAGLAAGFKPTASLYAVAMALSLAAVLRAAPLLRAWLGFAAAALTGAVAAGGWWAWQLWQRFGNPVFPLFNAVFRSPWYPPVNFVDREHLPGGVLQWLCYPLWWSWLPTDRVTEAPSADPRLAMALLLSYAAVTALLVRRTLTGATRTGVSQPGRLALAFTGLSYAGWLSGSSILRYAVPIEAMSALCIPLLLALLWPGAPRFPTIATALLLAAAAAITRYPAWGRAPYGAVTLAADVAWVAPETLFIVLTPPSSYILALLPGRPGVAAAGLLHTTLEARGWRLHGAVLARVQAQTGPVMVLLRGDGRLPQPALAEIGLSPEMGACRTITTTFDRAPGVLACAAHKQPPPALPDPFWALAATHYRTVQAVGAVYPFTALGYLQSAGPDAAGTRFTGAGTLLDGFHPALPARPDPHTLYVFGRQAPPMPSAADDLMARVDGVWVLAPGWRSCVPCRQAIQTVPAPP